MKQTKTMIISIPVEHLTAIYQAAAKKHCTANKFIVDYIIDNVVNGKTEDNTDDN